MVARPATLARVSELPSEGATRSLSLHTASSVPSSSSHSGGRLFRRPERLFPIGQRPLAPTQGEGRDPEELRVRFDGRTPRCFHPDGIVIFSTFQVKAPKGFEAAWCIAHERHCTGHLSEDERQLVANAAGCLICCSLCDVQQVRLAVALKKSISELVDVAPPTILVPHSSSSMAQPLRVGDANYIALVDAMRKGFCDVVIGEPAGLRLVMDVRLAIKRHELFAKRLQTQVNAIHGRRPYVEQMLAYYNLLSEASHDLVWDYMRSKSKSVVEVPEMDQTIDACETGHIVHGFKIGEVLGTGSYGRVHRLEDPKSSSPMDEVIKVLSKKSMTSSTRIKNFDTQLQIMKLLSTAPHGHPNLPKLIDVYQTRTDVIVRLSYGGPVDLYKRLKIREDQSLCITPCNVASIIYQCLQVLSHLHMVAKVVHADIKPENIIFSEGQDSVKITLVDFDLAVVMPSDGICSGSRGSFPFMAPEVVLKRSFFAYPTDIWSMGVVCLEVLCGVDILRKALRLRSGQTDRHAAERFMMRTIAAYFERTGSVDELLGVRLRSELRSLCANVVLNGMLTVPTRTRWKAARLREELSASHTFLVCI